LLSGNGQFGSSASFSNAQLATAAALTALQRCKLTSRSYCNDNGDCLLNWLSINLYEHWKYLLLWSLKLYSVTAKKMLQVAFNWHVIVSLISRYYLKRSVLGILCWSNGGVPALNDIIVLMMIIVQMQL
jgi:hypothetical protein